MTTEVASGGALLSIAARAIRTGFDSTPPSEPDLGECPAGLLEPAASFVTLTSRPLGLRGCRGMLEARRPLAADVWHNARASAFDDPRFPAVTREELADLDLEVSVLGSLEPLMVRTEDELRQVLVPGTDGVVLSWRGRRATFLPKVWDMLPTADLFMAQLKLKAGLPARFWAVDVEVSRYRVRSVRADLATLS
ncbi:MAG: AmmeMemoRadiSam system protein A [Gammaproteobacteria bacterium]|nr:AmmeMemoRadiSam system protein A [Gammaproteobacteria bacterium]